MFFWCFIGDPPKRHTFLCCYLFLKFTTLLLSLKVQQTWTMYLIGGWSLLPALRLGWRVKGLSVQSNGIQVPFILQTQLSSFSVSFVFHSMLACVWTGFTWTGIISSYCICLDLCWKGNKVLLGLWKFYQSWFPRTDACLGLVTTQSLNGVTSSCLQRI